jgi:hypothetical protein
MSLYVGPNKKSLVMDSGKILWNTKAVSFRPGAQESFAKEKASFCSFTRDLLTRSPQIFNIRLQCKQFHIFHKIPKEKRNFAPNPTFIFVN